MSDIGFCFFDTAIGRCGVVWNVHGVLRTRLPEGNEQRARERIHNRFPEADEIAPPAGIQHAIDAMVALLAGERKDLSGIRLDTSGVPDFNMRVYDVARTIPAGATLTYGEIADRLGDRTLARDVGVALGQNPFPIVVPCHRVLAAGGKTGGFSAPGGVSTKIRMLTIEQANIGVPAAADQLNLFEELPLAAQSRSPRRSRL
jgi:methylated-DNA-[protein]-cysteine S-methyltransferase